MDPELLAVVFGLASAASWGCGDFGGGLATRRGSVYGVVIGSQSIGLVLLTGLALVLGEAVPPSRDLLLGAIAGLAGAMGLTALYQGLARGRMGVVAPITAIVSAAIPVFAGAVLEGLPDIQKIEGIGLALVAVWLITRGQEALRIRWSELGLPVLSGLGFGLFMIIINQVSVSVVLWPLVTARIASVTALFIIAMLFRQRPFPVRPQLVLIAVSGIFDSAGNAFYVLAAQVGRMDIAAILSSLYPAGTAMLAHFIVKERLSRRQWLGVVTALAAIILIAL